MSRWRKNDEILIGQVCTTIIAAQARYPDIGTVAISMRLGEKGNQPFCYEFIPLDHFADPPTKGKPKLKIVK